MMYIVTADQINSRHQPDAVEATLQRLETHFRATLPISPERTAGDELQLATGTPHTALEIVLALARDGEWSIGLGIGDAELAPSIRASTGAAFIAARRAVDRAKRRTTRFALETEPSTLQAHDLEALIDLLLLLRARRSAEGWELHDLLQTGVTQAEAAARLGISPQAASARASAAALRYDTAATEALVRLLARWEAP